MSRRSKLVLVADDDPAMRDLVSIALRAEGYVVIEVATGIALVDTIERIVSGAAFGGVVDVVVSDVRMPDLDGLGAIARIRAKGVTVPFVVVTAFSDDATQRRAKELDATLLDKPVELRILRETVRAIARR